LSHVATRALDRYRTGGTSFVEGLRPDDALTMSPADVLELLTARFGRAVEEAITSAADPDAIAAGAPCLDGAADGGWLRRANVVGINMRTVGGAWGVVPYALTLPAIQDAIHVLPFVEPGVVGSLYGPVSWEIDPTLCSPALAEARPGLDTAEKQLRAVVNLLHAMGRVVGLDVIPHCDRFSQIVLAQPDHFEWIRRADREIDLHGSAVAGEVERLIHRWLRAQGAANGSVVPSDADALFRGLDEATRVRLLFGPPEDPLERRTRRTALVRELHARGLETLPASMGPPYRGLELDPADAASSVDAMGLEWREFRFVRPEPMSRVFGPLTRYALYEPAGDDSWELDFDRPREDVWRYVTGHYADLRDRFGMDFMRGDMAHIQMRPEGIPREIGPRYDILGGVRDEIHDRGTPSFGYLAESFLAPPGTFAYGDEMDHLEAAGADTALGDLQSTPVGGAEFSARFRRYLDHAATRSCTPSLTIMTADKDDPRFDAIYADGSLARLFIALLVPDLPSYMGLGFELRDVHDRPAPAEHYTKHYVFEATTGVAATSGPYRFGGNVGLFASIERIRGVAERLREVLARATTVWVRPPDATGEDRTLAWVLDDGAGPRHLCVANLDAARPTARFGVPRRPVADPPNGWLPIFSTVEGPDQEASPIRSNGHQWVVDPLAPGECRVYRSSTIEEAPVHAT
jgi:hypothetical protein